MRLLGSTLFLSTVLAAPWDAELVSSSNSKQRPPVRAAAASNAAAYFLENNPAGNSIVSLRIDSDGTLSHPDKFSTNGRGSIAVNGTGAPVAADSLGSQGSVHVSNNMLFAVNAGSNTLSMFAIDAQNASSLKLVGSPADTLGDFPVSVDYSAKLGKACVLNGGAKAGVTCFTVDARKGLQADGPLRALNQSIIDETTPPSGPPGQASQVLFNPASTALFVTIRGNPGTTPVKLGSIVAWPVAQDGCVSRAAPVVSQISGLILDFGFQFLSPTRIYMVDPAFGAALLDIGANLKATQVKHTVLPGENAVCWTGAYPHLNTLYAIDVGQNLVYTLNATTGAMSGTLEVQNPPSVTGAGLFDTAISSKGKMYSLAASNGVFVVDLATKKTQQYLDLAAVGKRQHYQGMAIWPSTQ